MKRLVWLVVLLLLAGCASPGGSAPPGGGPAPGPEPAPAPAIVLTATPVTLDAPQSVSAAGALTQPGVFVLEVAAGNLWRLNSTPFSGGLSWSRDGKTALLPRGDADSLDVLDLAAGTGLRLTGAKVREARLAPDGKLIAFTTDQGTYLARSDGTGLHAVAPDSGSMVRIRWAPDGAHLAFQAAGANMAEAPIRSMNVATGKISEAGNAWFDAFAWSPDGRQLALAHQNSVAVYTAATGARREIPWALAPGQTLDWSPDGAYLSTVANTPPGWTLASRRADGTEEPRNVATLMPEAVWAPDGGRLAYVNFGCESNDFDVYTVRPDGSDLRRLTASARELKLGLSWSPDGKSLAFGTMHKVVLADAATGQERVLAAEPAMVSVPSVQDWSPDGRYLVFALGIGKGYCH